MRLLCCYNALMLPQRRRKPVHLDHRPGDPYELQPIPPAAPPLPAAPEDAQNRTAEILTISVIVALLVLLGLGVAFWTLENRPARAPASTPTATPRAVGATGIPSPTPRLVTAQPAPDQASVTPGPAGISAEAPAVSATTSLRLRVVSLGGATGDAPEATAVAPTRTPTPAVSPTMVIVSLPFVSRDEVTPAPTPTATDTPTPAPPTPTSTSPVELTGIAPTATRPSAPTPTATSTPPPLPTSYQIDSLKAFVNRQSVEFYIGPSSIYTDTGSLNIDTEIRLYGRNETGEWVYACCVDNALAWVRQADVRIEGNELPGAPDDVEPNDVRWLRFEPVISTLRRLPTATPIPEGDFPLSRFTPDNRGYIQPLPNLFGAAKPWATEPQAGGSLVSPLVVAGSSVVVSSSDGHLYSFDRVNGNQRWRTNIGQLVTVAPAVDNNIIYIADNTGVLRALQDLGNATDEQWSRSLGAPPVSGINVFSRTLFVNLSQRLMVIDGEDGDVLSELSLPVAPQYPTIGGQLLYIATGALRVYDLMALIEERRVDLVWDEPNILNITAAPVYSSPGVKSLAELYVAGGNNRIYSLDANTGKEMWNQDNGETMTSLAVNNTALFISGNGYIRALSRVDGEEIWNRGISGQVLGGVYVDQQYLIAYLQNGSFLFVNASTGEVLANLAAYPAAATSGAAISRPYVFGPGNDGKLYSFRETP